MHMSSQRYINAASHYIYICILIYNTFCSATFYNDPPMITHAVAKELGPQAVKQLLGHRKLQSTRVVTCGLHFFYDHNLIKLRFSPMTRRCFTTFSSSAAIV